MFKRGGVWWCSITYNGKRTRKSLETKNKKIAQDLEARLRIDIVEGKYFENPLGKINTFGDMMKKFMKEHAPKVSLNTQKSYSASLKNLIPFFGDMTLSSITPKMISNYKVLRYDHGVKPATINRELALLSKAFNLAVKAWEWIKDNPVSKVPKEKENNERDRWLSEDEEKRILENSPQWLRDIIIFALHTGLRKGELLSLGWNRVDLFRKTIIIQESKNGKPRTLPLNKIAFEVLTEKAKMRNIRYDIVFCSSAGTQIDGDNIKRAFNSAVQKAGITDFHFHDLRHTFATRLAQKGVDIFSIAKLLGHKDIRMTQRYSHHSPESLRKGIQVLEAGHNLVTVKENQEEVKSCKSL